MLESHRNPEGDTPVRIVFLHGAGTGPWIWGEVRRCLEGPSVALAVPSDRRGTNPRRCASDLIADPAFPAHGPLVLVLHSLAGVLEGALLEALGSRVLQVVHVATVVPRGGSSFASAMGLAARVVLPILFWMNPRGLRPSPAMLLHELGDDLTDAQRCELVARYRSEQGGLFLGPAPSTEIRVPRAYVLCTKDRCVAPSLQARFAKRLGAEVLPIKAGHLPMLSRPGDLAGLLAGAMASARVGARGACMPARSSRWGQSSSGSTPTSTSSASRA